MKRKFDSKEAASKSDDDESFANPRKWAKSSSSSSSSSSSNQDDNRTHLHLNQSALVVLLTDRIRLCSGSKYERKADSFRVWRGNDYTMLAGMGPILDGMQMLIPAALNGGKHEEQAQTSYTSNESGGMFIIGGALRGANTFAANHIFQNVKAQTGDASAPTNWHGTWLGPWTSHSDDTVQELNQQLHVRHMLKRQLDTLVWLNALKEPSRFSAAITKLIAEFLPRVKETWTGRTVVRGLTQMGQTIPLISNPRISEIHLSDMAQVDLYSGDSDLFDTDGLTIIAKDAAVVRLLGGTFTMPVRIFASGRTQVFLSGRTNMDTMHVEVSEAAVLHARELCGNLLIVNATDDARVITNTLEVTSRIKQADYICENLATVEEEEQV